MNVLHVIVREILHRKLRFLIGILAVVIGVGSVTAAFTILKLHDQHTEEIVAVKEAEVQELMAKLQDESRRITKDMGFNLQIVPHGQVLDPFAPDYAALDMPADYASRLAEAKPGKINHVLPVLEKRVKWQIGAKSKTVFVIGSSGEVYIQSRKQAPLLEAIPQGKLVVGQDLAEDVGLKVDQEVELLGEKFVVSQLLPARDDKDRDTVWMRLETAQRLLGKPNRINGLLALECDCTANRLTEIKNEIGKLLPGTDILEFTSKANTRADVRNLAAYTADAELKKETATRADLRRQREALFRLPLPLIIAASVVWIAVLMWGAVRERRVEIAVLRAVGLRSWRILTLFLGNAACMGLVGAGLGIAAGVLTAALLQEDGRTMSFAPVSYYLMRFAIVVICAPLL